MRRTKNEPGKERIVVRNLQPGQILVFTIHDVPDIAQPGYTTSEEVFAEYLQYMKEHQFKVIAMRDLEKYRASY